MATNSPSLVILSSHTVGLTKDADLLTNACKSLTSKIVHYYPDESHKAAACDIQIHLEIPYYAWFPYAKCNIVVVNPEWWISEAFDPYLPKIDLLLFKNETAMELFKIMCPDIADKAALVPWCSDERPAQKNPKKEFLYLIGNSPNKAAAARSLIAHWKPSYPPLHVYSSIPGWPPVGDGVMSGNITINTKEQTEHSIRALQATYFGHVCVSEAEGFGFTAAEAESVGAFSILNHNEAYDATYEETVNGVRCVAFLPTTQVANEKTRSSNYKLDDANMPDAMDAAIAAFLAAIPDCEKVAANRRVVAANRRTTFSEAVKGIFARVSGVVVVPVSVPTHSIPPPLTIEDCPPISVVTLFYNRRKFWDLALHNMMTTDYPRNKIEWVIVDDSDDMEQSISDKITKITNFLPGLDVVYVPYHEKLTIGGKRNLGTKRAKHDIILMMDDDDHYPITSFRRRVAWLAADPTVQATACTAIALYDLRTGVSAVNIPPYSIPLGQRLSEATLTFRRSFFNDRKFEKVSMAEGENFIRGRETQVVELMPQQIIVTFCHGKNTSGRRLPPEASKKPACFWGFPKEYLKFIHKLADVDIEI